MELYVNPATIAQQGRRHHLSIHAPLASIVQRGRKEKLELVCATQVTIVQRDHL